jgi:hypothetical protein
VQNLAKTWSHNHLGSLQNLANALQTPAKPCKRLESIGIHNCRLKDSPPYLWTFRARPAAAHTRVDDVHLHHTGKNYDKEGWTSAVQGQK